MKKLLVSLLIMIVVIAIAIQLIPYGRNHANPPVVSEPKWANAETRTFFYRACADCHSNETVWPWYSNIAPVSWLVQRDVDEGREFFNVSQWGQREYEADEAAELVMEGEMPLPIYLLMHPTARLTPDEKDAFVSGLTATFGGEGE